MTRIRVQKEKWEYTCDRCDAKMDTPIIRMIFGYGSMLDGKDVVFCSDYCARRYIEGALFKAVKVGSRK